MKALLKKDIYLLTTQLKLFILMAVIFALTPNTYMNAFAVVYAAMLPYTAIAYDERSKWDRMAAMLPYSTRDLVLSKYVLGYVCVLAILVVTFLVKLVTAVVLHRSGEFAMLVPLTCLGFLILAVTLPFMMRFGVEKGRMIFTFAMVALAVGGSTFVSLSAESSGFSLPVYVVLPVLAVVGNIVSVSLAIRLYPRRSC